MFHRVVSALFLFGLVATLPCHADDDYYRKRDEYYKRLEEQQRRYDQDRVNYTWLYEDSFAAIAYSPKTGKFGYSYEYGSRAAANQAALKHVPEPDAEIVAWTRNAYCALAKGDDGYGAAWGDSAAQARANALAACAKHTTGGKVLVCVFAGN